MGIIPAQPSLPSSGSRPPPGAAEGARGLADGLLGRLVDRAACDPDGAMTAAEAIDEHRSVRTGSHGGVVGMLVVPVSALDALLRLDIQPQTEVVLVADTGLDRLPGAVIALRDAGLALGRVQAPVGMRGDDPVPGLRRLAQAVAPLGTAPVYAEIPLAGGLLDALDEIVAARQRGDVTLGATFRVGGLAAELFPSAPTLAGVLCACRERAVRFTISGGLRRAMRHNDPETGFTHHGVLNLLAACLAVAGGAASGPVSERLMMTDPVPLVELARTGRDLPRPLWTAYTASRIDELIADFVTLGILSRPPDEGPSPQGRSAAAQR